MLWKFPTGKLTEVLQNLFFNIYTESSSIFVDEIWRRLYSPTNFKVVYGTQIEDHQNENCSQPLSSRADVYFMNSSFIYPVGKVVKIMKWFPIHSQQLGSPFKRTKRFSYLGTGLMYTLMARYRFTTRGEKYSWYSFSRLFFQIEVSHEMRRHAVALVPSCNFIVHWRKKNISNIENVFALNCTM